MRELKIPREELVILTKCFFPVQKEPTAHPSQVKDLNTRELVNAHGLSRQHIFAAVDASLERLGTSYIDVLQCHRFDYETPLEETMDALHDVSVLTQMSVKRSH